MSDTRGMDESAVEELREVVGASLYLVSGEYLRRGDDLQYNGQRPGPGWHGHGSFSRWLRVLGPNGLSRLRLWKPRWLDPKAKVTCHSRPPDELGRVSVCSLTFVLLLYGYLQAAQGAARHHAVLDVLENAVTRRTILRWMPRACARAKEIQQAMRLAVIERSEPRPVERLFPRGLSPPDSLGQRNWRDPQAATILWRGLAILITGAVKLKVPAAILLAEARGRSATPQSPLLI